MPTGVYVRKISVEERLKAGMAADHAEDFEQWLRERRYTPLTIIERMRLLASWTHWARAQGYTIATIREAYAASFATIQAGYRPRFRGDLGKDAVEAAKLFISYLETCNALQRLPERTDPVLMSEFMHWAREQHGLAETTLGTYRIAILPFIAQIGDNPDMYDAAAIRSFMLGRAGTVSAARLKCIGVGVRAFLRFLIATGRCPPGLDHAMPKAATWQLTSIHRSLPDADIVRILKACEGRRRLRDRAIILLLVRLGLRASEVARLTFDDIDWHRGSIRLLGKRRREELLPLSQEVGDAIVAYIETARPSMPERVLFLTETAPIRPVNRIVIKCLATAAYRRAGIEIEHKGAHILRHSAASAMLRHGVRLADVGTVLRHSATAMTAHYAKVDMALLSTIAQPWPGRAAC